MEKSCKFYITTHNDSSSHGNKTTKQLDTWPAMGGITVRTDGSQTSWFNGFVLMHATMPSFQGTEPKSCYTNSSTNLGQVSASRTWRNNESKSRHKARKKTGVVFQCLWRVLRMSVCSVEKWQLFCCCLTFHKMLSSRQENRWLSVFYLTISGWKSSTKKHQ